MTHIEADKTLLKNPGKCAGADSNEVQAAILKQKWRSGKIQEQEGKGEKLLASHETSRWSSTQSRGGGPKKISWGQMKATDT